MRGDDSPGLRRTNAVIRFHPNAKSQLSLASAPFARPVRFELTTPGSVDRCSIQLSYGRTLRGLGPGKVRGFFPIGRGLSRVMSEGFSANAQWGRKRRSALAAALSFQAGALLRGFLEQALDELIDRGDGAPTRPHDQLHGQRGHIRRFDEGTFELPLVER